MTILIPNSFGLAVSTPAASIHIYMNDVANIAIKAGNKILDIYNDETAYNTAYKNSEKTDPVTAADIEANNIIVEELNKLCNKRIMIMSEESTRDSYDVRKQQRYLWVVDPLDGTKEFLKKNGQFTVNIGLIRDGKPILGIVTQPVTGDLFFAIENQGAHKMNYFHNSPLTRIYAKEFTAADENLIFFGSSSHANEETEKFAANFKNVQWKLMGSSLKITKIAEGEGHIYPRFALTSEWDICAAHIIVKEAGGHIYQVKDNRVTQDELLYNKENVKNPYFVVYGRLLI